ncbi:MAG: discoidin domain-containing protein [Verrucomicrobiae bacterium]|nr:discoidin domain-containing protein [Verrucomicrobiae bacterium]
MQKPQLFRFIRFRILKTLSFQPIVTLRFNQPSVSIRREKFRHGTRRRPGTAPCCLCAAISLATFCDAAAVKMEPFAIRSVKASSELPAYPAKFAIDGETNDTSRWVSRKSNDPSWLALDLGATHRLGGIHLFTGYGNKDPLETFQVQCWMNGQWTDIPSAAVSNNKNTALGIAFDQTLDVNTDKLRLWITASHQGTARVKEVIVWPYGPLPELPKGGGQGSSSAQSDIPEIYLNQSGFNLGKPKRFTAPTLADGTRFIVRKADGGPPLAEGVIKGHAGDFTSFNPESDDEYVVEAGGITSVPFRIGPFWLERVSYQDAVDFMIDSRHYVGNDRARCGGSFGWRDDHHFGWELHTLVPQYLSNPSAYERMPRQVKYEKPKDKKLWGALDPYPDEAPDIVKLIHWGADIIVTQKLGHEMLKSQLAYFLYAWPVLEPYLPEQNYRVVRDYAFETWANPKKDRGYPYDESPENNLLALKTKIGSTKGCLPPGFSVEPNLMMHEVAKREKRNDADLYFDAAFKQVEWMIKNLDWEKPIVTKGQRMSEFLTVTGLAHMLREYPDRAPAGLAAKLNDWAKVLIRRSDNMWDFRKLGDGPDEWTPMGDSPQKWNEPGNVVGLPAPILAAMPFIESKSDRQRLEQIVWSHFDGMFGRNPVGRHFSYDAPREVEGVEHGWFRFYPGGIGRLAEARFVIDGSPKNAHYPYHPERGDIGWTEGWVQFNTAFNISLAYLAWSETDVSLSHQDGELLITLTAPLNFDYQNVETGTVTVRSGQGDVEQVVVTEVSPSSSTFTGRIRLDPGRSASAGDKALQFAAGTTVKASHGYGYLGRHVTLKP